MLSAEFAGGIPNARCMVRDVSLPEALEIKERLAAVPGVEAVTWLDDAADVLAPLETQDKRTVETYYKDGAALYTLTISDEHRIDAVAAVREIAGETGALTGDAVSTADATTGTVAEVRLITVIAVLFVWFILTLTTSNWAEPVIVLAGLGVATVLNAGSNLVLRRDKLRHERGRQRAAIGPARSTTPSSSSTASPNASRRSPRRARR